MGEQELSGAGKWESISRHGSASGAGGIGTRWAQRCDSITLQGTKVAPVEGVRRLRRNQFPIPADGAEELADPFWQEHPDLWQVTDYTQAPKWTPAI